MKRLSLLFVICLMILNLRMNAQPYATWTKNKLTLSNGITERIIQLPAVKGPFLTTSYKPVQGSFAYFTANNTDFQFEINQHIYSGKSSWSLKSILPLTDSKQGDGAAVTLISEDGKVELTLQFLLYPGLPVIRKNLIIKNLRPETAQLESVDVEKFNVTGYGATTFSWICHDYGRRRSIGPYDGNMQDALVTVHNSDWQQGVVIGNEAAGVIKHTSVFWNGETICSGLTHKDARYPFRKYISAGESFTTPQVFYDAVQ